MRTSPWIVLAALIVAALAPVAPVAPVFAQGYPNRPIRLIAPFPPGGTSDVLGRLLAQKLTEGLGQPVTVENRPGAASNIGHEIAAKAAPDGYTLILSNSSALTTNPHLYKRLGFDPAGDFAPIALVASAGQVLVVHPAVAAGSVAELIALAKAKPGTLNFGSGGVGIQSHISGEMFKSIAGVSMVHVPYKGTIQAVTDCVAGQVHLVFADMVPALPQIRAGKLRPLAVTSVRRAAVLPEVPTMIESGVAGYDSGVWWAMLAPKATPVAIVERLDQEFGRILRAPDVAERYAGLGLSPTYGPGQTVADFVRAQTPQMAQILKAAGVAPE